MKFILVPSSLKNPGFHLSILAALYFGKNLICHYTYVIVIYAVQYLLEHNFLHVHADTALNLSGALIFAVLLFIVYLNFRLCLYELKPILKPTYYYLLRSNLLLICARFKNV